jgi:Putative Actinobacterial Holin-X, holin superfamily III
MAGPEYGLREQPMGKLFKELSNDLSTLVRQEMRLAQAEMTEKGKKAAVGVGLFGGAGIVGLLGLGALTTCLIAALATGVALWLAALIVTVVYSAAAGALAMTAKKEVSEATPPIPEQTVNSLKEDAQWAKTQLPSKSK